MSNTNKLPNKLFKTHRSRYSPKLIGNIDVCVHSTHVEKDQVFVSLAAYDETHYYTINLDFDTIKKLHESMTDFKARYL